MAYLKLWIDPRIITNEQIQLPEKVLVGTNPDDSDKYNLTITRGDSLSSDTWAEEARFLLTPDPEIGHMPVKTNEGLKYLLVESEFVGYNNYWTYYATTKLWLNVLEDSYGKFIRFGSNTSIAEYWRTLAQTYREDDQGNRVYYLFPKCGVDRGYGQYWHYPSATYIRSMIERNFDTIQKQSNISYINDNGERISRYPYTGVQEAISANTETEGGAVCITTRIHIEAGSSAVLYSVATFNTANVIDFKLNRSENDKYTITVPFPRHAGNVSGGITREIPNFDPTIPHRYVFIHRPDKVLEVWVDHVQYKKEDGSDIYYRKSGVYDSYDKDTYIWGYNKVQYEGVPVEDLYEFKLYQGELKYENTLELTASITASRNPVTTNVPSLSTSELTCHVEGIADRNSDKYKHYIEHDWGEVDFSVFPPRLLYADGTEWWDTDQIRSRYSSDKVTLDNEDCLQVKGGIYVRALKDNEAYRYPAVFCSNTQSIQIEFKFKVERDALSDRHNASLWSQGYYRGEEYNACGYMVELLSNGNWKVTTSNSDRDASSSKPCSDELHLSFYEWHDIKIIMCQLPEYTTGGRDGYNELYIDGVYIPFRMPENYTGTDTSRLVGTNVKAEPSSGSNVTMRNYWHYEFSSYRNWFEEETIYYKDYKIKTLTENPDYEEYPELTYLWDTGETTKQITVQPTEPTTYSCTVTQGSRTANASILIDTTLKLDKPIAVISPQEKPYIEHMIGRFYATNSYDINDPASPIVKYIWNDVETISPVFVTRVKRTDKIRLRVVNALGLESDEVEVDLSKDTDQWGHKYKFLDIPMFLICSKGANLFDTLISRFPIPSSTLDLYSNFYPTEYDKYTSIGFTTDISTDTIRYMACLPHHGVAEYTANREQVDIYPLGISWLEKRNMIKYYNKVKGSKGSLMACIGHPEIQEEGYGSLEFVLDALGIITPKERYTIPRLLDLLELLLMDYDNGGLIKL